MSAVGALHAIDQADAALSAAGLPPFDIFRHELREARAAVAELIEAANNYQQAMDGTRDLAYRCEMGRLLEAALARVTGAQS